MMNKESSYVMAGTSELLFPYGRHTPYHNVYVRSYEAAMPHKSVGNHWSSSEYNSNNSWNVNFNNGNSNNNNKFNELTVRPAVAHEQKEWKFLRATVQFAYRDCIHGKRSSKQAQDYIPHADEDLDVLTDELYCRTYKPDASTCFLVKFPKLREVFAAAFRDRVIHHWICLRLEPYFEMVCESQGNVTHNCRKGFGTKTAVESVYNGIKQVTHDYGKEAWIFKGDLVGFFMSIPQRRMCDKLLEFTEKHYVGVHKDLLLWLIEVVVMHRPEKNCMFNSTPEGWQNLPKNKSLFRCDEGKGAPIGNLTTQLFANFYMSEFDGYVAEVFKGKRYTYTRFVDDFIIVCDDKKFMLKSVRLLEKKLEEMGLQLHRDKRYVQPASHGVMFVGTYLKNGRMYLSSRTIGRFENAVYGFCKYLQLPEDQITEEDLNHIRATMNSYLGFCKGRKMDRKRKEIVRTFMKSASKYFYRDYLCTKVKLKPKYRPIIK